jgi:CRISPR-associated endonuclease Csn1
MNNKVFMGVDIGTASAAVVMTDGDYNVLKYGKTPLACARLFEEAETAKDRRLKRGYKIRKDRLKQRLRYLEEFFAEEIEKVDPLFFLRLHTSAFRVEDKKNIDNRLDFNSLFSDSDFKDRDYYYYEHDPKKSTDRENRFPTVYHLRNWLMQKETWEGEHVPDIRFVFLAIYHILKHRGNFLWKQDTIDINGQDLEKQGQTLFEELNSCIAELN